ncbi:CoA ester lyase [Pseudonocardia nematodicida]|uniref:CoA ester lyase n=1 Tax=Pseudonocardia nematodicida TaxID=1206997 RepID=A0ABV1KK84_9PSEU
MRGRDTGGAVLHGPALLFCPGDRPDRFGKALAAADSVILDLEDAVGPDAKDAARDAVVAALPGLDLARVLVRVNAPGTPWHDADVRALAPFPEVTVLLPMVAAPEDVAALAPRPVIALCETARGVLAAPSIATAENCAGLMWGSEDLLADLGARPVRLPGGGYRPALQEARTRILYAARAAGRAPVDTVLVDIDDLDTLAADSADAAADGYVAKACIHPSQAETVRHAFRPDDRAVAWAREVVDEAAARPGVFRLRGQMIDAPVVAYAREVLRRAGVTG